MAPIYDEPAWALLRICITDNGAPMTRQQIVSWFEQNYPQIKDVTVKHLIVSCCVNNPSRKNYQAVHTISYRQPDGTFIAYDPEKHGRFTREGQPEGGLGDGLESSEGQVEPTVAVEEVEQPLIFTLERDLQVALRQDIGQLGSGLTIIDGGSERTVKAGRIDITASDREGNLVVIELKTEMARQDSIGQVMAYIGSLKNEEHRPVRGILVAGHFHPNTVLAAQAIPGLQLKKYSYKFSFEDV